MITVATPSVLFTARSSVGVWAVKVQPAGRSIPASRLARSAEVSVSSMICEHVCITYVVSSGEVSS